MWSDVWIRRGPKIGAAIESSTAAGALTLIDDLGSNGTPYRSSWQPVDGGILEVLELADERGYVDWPRRATLEELTAVVGITRQSLAGRLRFGH